LGKRDIYDILGILTRILNPKNGGEAGKEGYELVLTQKR
jgi:hypothetical protein